MYNLPVLYDDLNPQEIWIVREKYIKEQKGLCCHCKGDLYKPPPERILDVEISRCLFPPNFFKYPIHLHHDHDTGLTVGAIHNYCNAILWEHHGE